MEYRIIFVMFLTFVIHLIGTLAYSIRIVGVRIGIHRLTIYCQQSSALCYTKIRSYRADERRQY